MTEPKPPRSRTAWPGPLSVAGVGEGHTHDLPKALRTRYRLLMVAVVALLLAVGTLTFFVYQQQQYIEGRGEYRDREAARVEAENEERTRRAACDLLDTFPEGLPSLQRARDKYDCGPGIPLSLLTPEEQERVMPRLTPPPERPGPLDEAGRSRERPPLTGGASPDRPAPAPEPTPERPTPAPTDLIEPATDLVCDLVPCLEENP